MLVSLVGRQHGANGEFQNSSRASSKVAKLARLCFFLFISCLRSDLIAESVFRSFRAVWLCAMVLVKTQAVVASNFPGK